MRTCEKNVKKNIKKKKEKTKGKDSGRDNYHAIDIIKQWQNTQEHVDGEEKAEWKNKNNGEISKHKI